jgi:glycosyltransferase involved in cell wall biosynthesis
MLENVFAKELGKTSEIIWFVQGDRSKGKIVGWHNSKVHIAPMLKGKDIVARLINRLLVNVKRLAILRYLLCNKVDIVFLRDLPLDALFLSLMKSYFGFKLYYQYSAPLGEITIGYSKLSTSSAKLLLRFQGVFYRLLVRKALQRSDIVFPITEFHKESLAAQIELDRLVPLTMGVNEDWIKRKPRQVPLLEQIKELNHLIGYVGTLSFIRNPKFMLDVFAKVKFMLPKCKLVVIGKTNTAHEQKELDDYCKLLQIQQDVIFTGHVSRDDVHDYLSQCDLTISLIPPTDYYVISSPTKMYESLGVGVPVLANIEIYEQNRVISESKGGILTSYDVQMAAEKTIELLGDRCRREKMGVAGSEYVIRNYSYVKIAERISYLFS